MLAILFYTIYFTIYFLGFFLTIAPVYRAFARAHPMTHRESRPTTGVIAILAGFVWFIWVPFAVMGWLVVKVVDDDAP